MTVWFGNAAFEMIFTIFITIYVSAGFGLLISAISKNGDRAMSIAPFILIIQLLFSGILFSLNGVTEKVSYFTFSRWSMEALGSTNDLNGLIPVGKEDADEEDDEMFVRTGKHMAWCWGLLFGVTFVFAGLSILVLTRLKNEQR